MSTLYRLDMTLNNRKRISIIVTALNEEKNISGTIENIMGGLGRYNIDGEIIVINDGSNDMTKNIVEGLMKTNDRIRLICHDTPQGVGASFWHGVDVASGNTIVWFPGDNENDSQEIFRYYGLIEHVDIVIPFIFNKEVRSVFRNALSFIYRFIINTTFQVNFNYTNGTIIYRKSILDELEFRSMGFFFQTDILVRVAKKGYLFAEVPYRLGMRKDGVSKAVSFPSLVKVAKGYLRLVDDFYIKKSIKANGVFSADSSTAARKKKTDI